MKTIWFLFFTLLYLHPTVAQQDFTKKIQAQSGQTLKMQLSSGASVNIYTWPEQSVEAQIKIIKCQGGECEVSLEATEYGALLKSQVDHRAGSSTSTSIKIDVWLPNDFDVEITSAGGAITATGLNGSLTGRCGGGNLKINDMNGKVAFNTGGGAITIDRGHLQASLATGGGNIEINNAYVKGKLSTGGGNIKASGIYIFSPQGNESSKGILSMSTGAGNIQVGMAHDSNPETMDMQLNTGSGKVTVEIPNTMDPMVDIEMAYTRKFLRQEIKSDIVLETEETQQWDARYGTPRRYVYGKSVAGNQGQSITIRNINGDVVIRKY